MSPVERSSAHAIRRVLKQSDDLRRPPWCGNANYLAGHCYVASEAFFHLVGGFKSDWRPAFIRWEGSPHWYLVNTLTGKLVDLTASQFSSLLDYSSGRRKGFLTKGPSKRAKVLMGRVLQKV